MARTSSKRPPDPAQSLPEVSFSDDGPVRHLHLGTPWIQGSMRVAKPYDLELEYVQRMMAWLLFVEPTQVPHMMAMQLGLGAGSLTKFCYKRLHMSVAVVELNPQVVAACRGWFRLPDEDERLQIILADAGQEIQRPQWQRRVDVLHVDLYDHEAAAPVLDDAAFYAHCRATLTDAGCMVVNLFGRSSSYVRSVAAMAAAFGQDALWAFKATREGNIVVLAQRTPGPPEPDTLHARAAYINQHWGLPTLKWLRAFRPIGPA